MNAHSLVLVPVESFTYDYAILQGLLVIAVSDKDDNKFTLSKHLNGKQTNEVSIYKDISDLLANLLSELLSNNCLILTKLGSGIDIRSMHELEQALLNNEFILDLSVAGQYVKVYRADEFFSACNAQ